MKIYRRYIQHLEDIIPHYVWQKRSGRFTFYWLGRIIIFDKLWKKPSDPKWPYK